MRLNRFIGLAVCVLVAACGQELPSRSTDWVLTNGRIYTVDEDQPWAEAVVIRDGVFIYVGDNAGVQAFLADGAKITDLRGRMVIPGIVDGHTHPGQIDLTRYEASFDADTREEFMAELEAYARENAGDGWLRGCCWPVQEFVDGVDAAVGQHPVCGSNWRFLATSCDEHADGEPDESIEAHRCSPQ